MTDHQDCTYVGPKHTNCDSKFPPHVTVRTYNTNASLRYHESSTVDPTDYPVHTNIVPQSRRTSSRNYSAACLGRCIYFRSSRDRVISPLTKYGNTVQGTDRSPPSYAPYCLVDVRATRCPQCKTTRVSPVWGMVPSWTPFIIFSASLWSCLQREISMKSWTVTTSRIYRGSIGCHRLWLETSGDSAESVHCPWKWK